MVLLLFALLHADIDMSCYKHCMGMGHHSDYCEEICINNPQKYKNVIYIPDDRFANPDIEKPRDCLTKCFAQEGKEIICEDLCNY